MIKHRWLLVPAAALVVVGCYKTPKPNCTFSCGVGASCPTDYTCGPDSVCHLMAAGGGLAPCEQAFNDAAQADALVVDTPQVDDASVDAHDDAHVDAHVDAHPDANLCVRLMIMSDGSSNQSLVLSLVQPHSGGKVELYNTTSADIDLSASTLQLVSDTNTSVLSGNAVTVKAHGYSTIPWPFGDLDGGGEVTLYDSSTHMPANIIDFVCWDTDAVGTSALADAQSVSKWSTATPACAGALTGTPKELERKDNFTGTLGSDYDPAAMRIALDCQAP